MCWKVKNVKKSATLELAEAISTFNLPRVASLLSDSGRFAVQNPDYDISLTDKTKFIFWLENSYAALTSGGRRRHKLSFTIVQSMHSISGSSIILFNEGHFPRFSGLQADEEKSGMIIKTEKDMVTGIEFCFLIIKTENPFIYERRCLKPKEESA
jgi:hypothetical protein